MDFAIVLKKTGHMFWNKKKLFIPFGTLILVSFLIISLFILSTGLFSFFLQLSSVVEMEQGNGPYEEARITPPEITEPLITKDLVIKLIFIVLLLILLAAYASCFTIVLVANELKRKKWNWVSAFHETNKVFPQFLLLHLLRFLIILLFVVIAFIVGGVLVGLLALVFESFSIIRIIIGFFVAFLAILGVLGLLYLAMRFFFMTSIFMLEKQSAVDAISKSYTFTKKHMKNSFFTFLILAAIQIVSEITFRLTLWLLALVIPLLLFSKIAFFSFIFFLVLFYLFFYYAREVFMYCYIFSSYLEIKNTKK